MPKAVNIPIALNRKRAALAYAFAKVATLYEEMGALYNAIDNNMRADDCINCSREYKDKVAREKERVEGKRA